MCFCNFLKSTKAGRVACARASEQARRPSDDRLGLTFNCRRFITHPFIGGIVPPFSIQMSPINLGEGKLTTSCKLGLLGALMLAMLLKINAYFSVAYANFSILK